MKLNTEDQNTPDSSGAALKAIFQCMREASVLLATAITIHRIIAQCYIKQTGEAFVKWESLPQLQKQVFYELASWHLAEVKRAMAMRPAVIVVKGRAHDGQ